MRQTRTSTARDICIFLATVVVTMWGALALEQAVRHHDVLKSLRMISPRAAIAQPLLLTLGYFLVVWLVGPAMDEGRIHRVGLHAGAAILSVLVLGLISVLAQGTRFSGTVAISVAVGIVVSLLMLGPVVRPLKAS